MRKNAIAIAVALTVILAVGLLSTLAYFTDKKEVTNTFTVGNLAIDLTEPVFVADSKLLPGTEIPKDPTVKLLEGSEDAYIFMQIIYGGNIMSFLDTISVNTNWKLVTGRTDLYVYAPGGTEGVVTTGTSLPALFSKVVVKQGLDGASFTGFSAANDKITIKAFAHQAYINGALDYTTAENAAKVQLP